MYLIYLVFYKRSLVLKKVTLVCQVFTTVVGNIKGYIKLSIDF